MSASMVPPSDSLPPPFINPERPVKGLLVLLIIVLICLIGDLATGFTFVGVYWGILVAAIVVAGHVLFFLGLKKRNPSLLYSFMAYEFIFTFFILGDLGCTIYLDMRSDNCFVYWKYVICFDRTYIAIMTAVYAIFALFHIASFVLLGRLARAFDRMYPAPFPSYVRFPCSALSPPPTEPESTPSICSSYDAPSFPTQAQKEF